ncbi:hypothetical protein AVEN_62800-1 [Araneus ventricosus]|uniref:Uncharacterized protein n=1 Tax=Araneus ventricosus TaxID=182803 RepID=A0A4Y2RE45_ARAVE|nr:hypothetical protein AVEN_62800-1 [Araneus ventricosus]
MKPAIMTPLARTVKKSASVRTELPAVPLTESATVCRDSKVKGVMRSVMKKTGVIIALKAVCAKIMGLVILLQETALAHQASLARNAKDNVQQALSVKIAKTNANVKITVTVIL